MHYTDNRYEGIFLLTKDQILRKLLSVDLELAKQLIISYIRNYFIRSHAKMAIMGLSGGVDSSTTLALLVEALGSDRVHVLILPYEGVSPKRDIEDAISLSESFKVKYDVISIKPMVDSFRNILERNLGNLERITIGNIMARTRMITLYAYANNLGGLVVGTGDKSEIMIGYFTKYGDGAADIMPIGDLYKTQVRRLALKLGVPEEIAFKTSSPALWAGQEAEAELGAKYEDIDAVLYALIELGLDPSEVLEIKDIDKKVITLVLSRVSKYEHKRKPPAIPNIQKIIAYLSENQEISYPPKKSQ